MPVKHGIAGLVDQQAHIVHRQRRHHRLGFLRAVTGNSYVEGLAARNGVGQSTSRLFNRSVGIRAVAVKNVDVIEAHAGEALVE